MSSLSGLPYFIFKGQKSTDLGVVIKELPPISKSQKNIDSISIDGRNGNLHIDNGTYKTKNYSVKCILTDISKIKSLKTLLDSTGKLELSTEPNIEYNATVMNQIDFSKYLTYLKEFPVNFEVDPIGYSKTSKTNTYTASENTFEVDGTVNVAPIITVTGTGTFTLNNKQVEVLETGIVIDCLLMNCTKNNLNKNDKVVLDEFPELIVGENTLNLGAGITSIQISYKEGWL